MLLLFSAPFITAITAGSLFAAPFVCLVALLAPLSDRLLTLLLPLPYCAATERDPQCVFTNSQFIINSNALEGADTLQSVKQKGERVRVNCNCTHTISFTSLWLMAKVAVLLVEATCGPISVSFLCMQFIYKKKSTVALTRSLSASSAVADDNDDSKMYISSSI